MRVYITGINGMLGSHLASLLVREGHHVWGCDIRKTFVGDFKNCDHVDIRNEDKLTESMVSYRPDAVVHAAAMLGVANTEAYPNMCNSVNVEGTVRVVTAANKAKAGTLLFLSSSEVYGNQSCILTEDSPILGDNIYAEGKYRAECLVRKFFDGRAVIARMFNCFGVGQVAQFLIPRAVRCYDSSPTAQMPLYGNPANLRGYCYATDAATYLSGLLMAGRSGEAYNVGSSERVTLANALTLIRHHANPDHDPNIKAYKVRTTKYDDREISRDVPNRLGDMTKLYQTVERIPMDLSSRIEHLCRVFGSNTDALPTDWNYPRETGIL